MKVTITFRHLEHTESLDQRILEKTEKLKKYLGGRTHIRWHCYVRNNSHYAEIVLHGPNIDQKSTAHTDCLYKSIDAALLKIEKQLVKKKEKLKSRRAKGAGSNLVILDPVVAWMDLDEDQYIQEKKIA